MIIHFKRKAVGRIGEKKGGERNKKRNETIPKLKLKGYSQQWLSANLIFLGLSPLIHSFIEYQVYAEVLIHCWY